MQDRAVLGDWNLRCDSCGRKIKASRAKKRWDGFWVCPEDWEPRHILDWYHSTKDVISVSWVRDQQRAGTESFTGTTVDGSSLPETFDNTTEGDPVTTNTFADQIGAGVVTKHTE